MPLIQKHDRRNDNGDAQVRSLGILQLFDYAAGQHRLARAGHNLDHTAFTGPKPRVAAFNLPATQFKVLQKQPFCGDSRPVRSYARFCLFGADSSPWPSRRFDQCWRMFSCCRVSGLELNAV